MFCSLKRTCVFSLVCVCVCVCCVCCSRVVRVRFVCFVWVFGLRVRRGFLGWSGTRRERRAMRPGACRRAMRRHACRRIGDASCRFRDAAPSSGEPGRGAKGRRCPLPRVPPGRQCPCALFVSGSFPAPSKEAALRRSCRLWPHTNTHNREYYRVVEQFLS
jgi:hypothetical protein